VEQVCERQLGEVTDAATAAAEQRGGRRGGDLVQSGGVGHRHAAFGLYQRLAEGDGAAAAALRELGEDAQLVEQIDTGAEAALQEVGLDDAEVHELAQTGNLRQQRRALSVSE